MPLTYDVYQDGEPVDTLTAEQVEVSYQLDPDELAWAIEEYGRCDIDDDEGKSVTFVEHGDPAPKRFTDPQ